MREEDEVVGTRIKPLTDGEHYDSGCHCKRLGGRANPGPVEGDREVARDIQVVVVIMRNSPQTAEFAVALIVSEERRIVKSQGISRWWW